MSAGEKELSSLHVKVAAILNSKLDQCTKAEMLLHEHKGELPEDVADFLEECMDASPALLTVVTKFLKDNDITVNKEDSEKMSDLEERLKAKRNRTSVIPIKDSM